MNRIKYRKRISVLSGYFLIKDTIILGIMPVRRINNNHRIQSVKYSIAAGIYAGLFLNYGEQKVKKEEKIENCLMAIAVPN